MNKLINNKVINFQQNVINQVKNQSPSKNIANFIQQKSSKTDLKNLTQVSFKPNQQQIVGSASNKAAFGLTFSTSKQFYNVSKGPSQILQKNKLMDCQKSIMMNNQSETRLLQSSKYYKNNQIENNMLALNQHQSKPFPFQKYSEFKNFKKIDSFKSSMAEIIPKYFQKLQFQDLKTGLVYSQGVILAYEIINSIHQFIPVLGTAKSNQEIASIMNSTNNRLDETINWLSHLQDKEQKMKHSLQPQPVVIADELEMLNQNIIGTRKEILNQIYKNQIVTIQQNQKILEYFLNKKKPAKAFQTVVDVFDDDATDRIEISKTIHYVQELKTDINQIKSIFESSIGSSSFSNVATQVEEVQAKKAFSTSSTTTDETKQTVKNDQEQQAAKRREQREQEKREWQQKREQREKQEQEEKREYEENRVKQEQELVEQQSKLRAQQQDLEVIWEAKFKDLQTELQFTKQQVLREIVNNADLYQSKLQLQGKVSDTAMQSIRNLEQTIEKIQTLSDISKFEKQVKTKFDDQNKDMEKLQQDQDYLQHEVDVLREELESVKKQKKTCNIF